MNHVVFGLCFHRYHLLELVALRRFHAKEGVVQPGIELKVAYRAENLPFPYDDPHLNEDGHLRLGIGPDGAYCAIVLNAEPFGLDVADLLFAYGFPFLSANFRGSSISDAISLFVSLDRL